MASQAEEVPAPSARRPQPRLRWRRFARALSEIPIVTAGILIAFALDTWWDNHGTADSEQVHLRALTSDFEQNVAALQALVNSGGLMLIRDESLRAALAKFAAQAGGTYSESWSNEHYFAFAREFGGTFMLYSWERNDRAADQQVVLEILHNPRFQEHLVMRYYSERDMARKYRALLKQAEGVLALLRTQTQS